MKKHILSYINTPRFIGEVAFCKQNYGTCTSRLCSAPPRPHAGLSTGGTWFWGWVGIWLGELRLVWGETRFE